MIVSHFKDSCQNAVLHAFITSVIWLIEYKVFLKFLLPNWLQQKIFFLWILTLHSPTCYVVTNTGGGVPLSFEGEGSRCVGKIWVRSFAKDPWLECFINSLACKSGSALPLQLPLPQTPLTAMDAHLKNAFFSQLTFFSDSFFLSAPNICEITHAWSTSPTGWFKVQLVFCCSVTTGKG